MCGRCGRCGGLSAALEAAVPHHGIRAAPSTPPACCPSLIPLIRALSLFHVSELVPPFPCTHTMEASLPCPEVPAACPELHRCCSCSPAAAAPSPSTSAERPLPVRAASRLSRRGPAPPTGSDADGGGSSGPPVCAIRACRLAPPPRASDVGGGPLGDRSEAGAARFPEEVLGRSTFDSAAPPPDDGGSGSGPLEEAAAADGPLVIKGTSAGTPTSLPPACPLPPPTTRERSPIPPPPPAPLPALREEAIIMSCCALCRVAAAAEEGGGGVARGARSSVQQSERY